MRRMIVVALAAPRAASDGGGGEVGLADLERARLVAQALPAGTGTLVLDAGAGFVASRASLEIQRALGDVARLADDLGWQVRVVGCAEPGDRIPCHASLDACLEECAPADARQRDLALTLPARLEYLAPVRKHLAAAVRVAHGDADAFQVEILVDELCLNAVENSPSTLASYDVRFRLLGHELQVDVTNQFDPDVEPVRTMHRRLESFDDSGRYLGERGRGLFLIARIADGLQIRSLDGDHIRVTVTKRLRGEAGSEPAAEEERGESKPRPEDAARQP